MCVNRFTNPCLHPCIATPSHHACDVVGKVSRKAERTDADACVDRTNAENHREQTGRIETDETDLSRGLTKSHELWFESKRFCNFAGIPE